MKKFFLSFLFLFFLFGIIVAQKNNLLVKSGDKGLYLEHKVVAKESFFSVGRLYNVHPHFVASYNKLDLKKGLQIDQKLRIPLTDTNFTQQGNSGTPVYYKTGDKEGLLTVSKANKNVLLSSLRAWNNLDAGEVKEGMKLVIGFLKSKEMPVVTLTPKIKTEEKPIAAEEKPKAIEEKPVAVEEKPKVTEDKPVVVEEKPKVTEEKQVVEKPVVNTDIKPVVMREGKSGGDDGGYFKSHFEQQIKQTAVSKDATVTAGIFKTTSGWQDKKYYLLMDGVQPGFIVKIINPTNNKAVYAKVLGGMSGIRQNEGLNIRISNAAAAVLEVAEQDKFIVRVNY
jgi:LysM repeat protein